ncbi:hypothetical protein ZWY2020_017287 [Hordeum vulgare]|nr:hypothetical protein ZWY2020_017287 [Hordeum vulgare]
MIWPRPPSACAPVVGEIFALPCRHRKLGLPDVDFCLEGGRGAKLGGLNMARPPSQCTPWGKYSPLPPPLLGWSSCGFRREEHINSGNDESPLMRNETESCDKTLSGDPSAQFDTKSPSGATSQLNLPSDSDVCSSKNNSPTDTLVNSQELEQKIRGSAAGLANRLCELKSTRPADTERDSGITHEEIKLIGAKELGLLKETCTEHFKERNAHKDLTKINARPIKQMPRR